MKRRKLSKCKIYRAIYKPSQLLDFILINIKEKIFHKKFIETKTFWNQSMKVIINEPVSLSIFFNGFTEPEITLFLIDNLKNGDIFFDVGAHIGFFTLLSSFLVGDNGKIFSFEPTPSIFDLLKENTSKSKNVEIFNIAILDDTKEIDFYDLGFKNSAFNSFVTPRSKFHSIENKIKVKTNSLDNLIELKGFIPKLIKIDAESAEYLILKGSTNLLTNYDPIIVLEVGDYGIEGIPKTKVIISFLQKYHYTCYDIFNGKLSPHEIKDYYTYTNLVFKK
jgi:FkbM family methyltransferase